MKQVIKGDINIKQTAHATGRLYSDSQSLSTMIYLRVVH